MAETETTPAPPGPSPLESDMLVGFYDLTGFVGIARSMRPAEVLELMRGYFALTGRIIQETGGRLIKVIGDAGLFAYPGDMAEQGVCGAVLVKEAGDAWLAERGVASEAVFKVHVGVVACGPVGAPGEERLDIYGDVVNQAATLAARRFALSPALHSRLSGETRGDFALDTDAGCFEILGEP